jgi:hypothetical protein
VTALADAVFVPFIDESMPVSEADLLVLVGDAYSAATSANPVVLRVPAAAVANASGYAANCPGSYGASTQPCTGNSGGSALVTQASLAGTFQPGEAPVSMDFWPGDGSIFIATSLGNIYQLQLTSAPGGVSVYGAPTLFATTPQGIKQVRVAGNQGNRYVFATIHASGGDQVAVFAGYPSNGAFSYPTPGVPNPPGVATATVNGAVGGLAAH